MPKISIVSPYYNRKPELYRTLKSLTVSYVKDFEYIVVDDASDPDHRLEDLHNEFSFLKLIRVEPKDKFYLNPCIPYNMGIAAATGDFIILQSPECFHIGDVLGHVIYNIQPNQYLVFACYSLDPKATIALDTVNYAAGVSVYFDALSAIGTVSKDSCESAAGRYNTWFAHSEYRPCMFNFLVALTMEDMRSLGGFNEAFYDGHSYDDTEFASRVVKKHMDVVYVDSPFCLHQYHPSVLNSIPNFAGRLEKNKRLYEQSLSSTEYFTKNSFLK